LALLRRELRVASLGDGAAEDVEDADVLAAAGEAGEPGIEFVRVLPGELTDGMDLKEFEVVEHGAANAGEIFELARIGHGAF
jgi:acyl-coenzyme A thioesterase PaaI-like protein